MAYLIAVAGAGGKSTYIDTVAMQYITEGKSVAILTTTHIWDPSVFCAWNNPQIFFPSGQFETIKHTYMNDTDTKAALRDGISIFSVNNSHVFGRAQESGKLSFPGEEVFKKICNAYDIVLAEADGSRGMPMKIPGRGEPVIPENADEIVIIMGKRAEGRRLKDVCQRYELLDVGKLPDKFYNTGADSTVDRELIQAVEKTYYRNVLRKKYPDALIKTFLSDINKGVFTDPCGNNLRTKRNYSHEKITVDMIVLASGFSRRYGTNKLLERYRGKKLYLYILDELKKACEILEIKDIKTQITIVTQYEDIINEVKCRENGTISTVFNENAAEGISASIRLGLENIQKKYLPDTSEEISDKNKIRRCIVYFAADMPHLKSEDITDFIIQYLHSGKNCACMETEKTPVNPAAFFLRADITEAILKLDGDRGAMKLLKAHPWDVYRYQIDKKSVLDMDTPDDFEN